MIARLPEPGAAGAGGLDKAATAAAKGGAKAAAPAGKSTAAAKGKGGPAAPAGGEGSAASAPAADDAEALQAAQEAATVCANLKFTNPVKVPCTVNFTVKPRGWTAAAGQKFPMDIYPASIVIPPNESRCVGLALNASVCHDELCGAPTLAQASAQMHPASCC